MPSTFKIPVKNLNAAFLKEMKEKYSEAELEITINRKPDFIPLKEDEFWAIIELLAWEQTKDEDIIEPAVQKLASLPVAQIYSFEEILAEKLYQLDQKKYAEQIGESSFKPDRYFSVDVFLYARACVVANGKEAFEIVLTDPSAMPKDITFEPLLSLASRAYERKRGREFIYIPTHSYETYSNQEGWDETQA